MDPGTKRAVTIEQAGIYQADLYFGDSPPVMPLPLTLTVGERQISGQLRQSVFIVLRLPVGEIDVVVQAGEHLLDRMVLTSLADSSDLARRFTAFENRAPRLGVHVGLRRDCGSALAPVSDSQTVESTEVSEFVFEDAISNFPNPNVEKDNVNYLAGVREIGVRSEYTDGRDMPRLLIRSIQFAKYDRFLSEQLAGFLKRLQYYKDVNGSVLDNSIVLYGSGASTTHWPKNLPTLVAGGTNMGLQHGTYWRNSETAMSNLYLSILRSMGIEQESFADSTGVLTDSIFSAV